MCIGIYKDLCNETYKIAKETEGKHQIFHVHRLMLLECTYRPR